MNRRMDRDEPEDQERREHDGDRTAGNGSDRTAIANSGSFGNVCLGSLADELLTINNAGSRPLSIIDITSSSPDFLTPAVFSYPLIVNPGDPLE